MIEDVIIRVRWVVEGLKNFVKGATINQKLFREIHNSSGKLLPVFRNLLPLSSKIGLAFRRATVGLYGFRMEMLSTMFFGMAMQRTFMGLLRPAFQAAGVFDIFQSILEINISH